MTYKKDITVWVSDSGAEFKTEKEALENDVFHSLTKMFEVIFERNSYGDIELNAHELKKAISKKEACYINVKNAINCLDKFENEGETQ